MFVIYSWDMLIKEGTAEIIKPTFWQKTGALLKDPLRFGPGWQMVFMNFTVSGVGIFMAVKLNEIFRVWPHREERITLTGHWHILASLIATIILLYFADLSGLKGRIRKWFGWMVIIMSDLAFASATIFSMKRLFISESEQQSIVNWTMLLTDIGLAVVLLALAIFMLWRLIDLFKVKGYWRTEYKTEVKSTTEKELEEQKSRLAELEEKLEEMSK
jgi:large-conductance mechanosensitive channel